MFGIPFRTRLALRQRVAQAEKELSASGSKPSEKEISDAAEPWLMLGWMGWWMIFR
jgi:hypothetical protein